MNSTDGADIAKLIRQFLQHRDRLIRDVFSLLKTVEHKYYDLVKFLPELGEINSNVSYWNEKIDLWQLVRQQSIWRVIENLVSLNKQLLTRSYLTQKNVIKESDVSSVESHTDLTSFSVSENSVFNTCFNAAQFSNFEQRTNCSFIEEASAGTELLCRTDVASKIDSSQNSSSVHFSVNNDYQLFPPSSSHFLLPLSSVTNTVSQSAHQTISEHNELNQRFGGMNISRDLHVSETDIENVEIGGTNNNCKA